MAELQARARNVGQGSWSSQPTTGTPGGSGGASPSEGGIDPQGIAGSATQSGTVEFNTPNSSIKPVPENLTPAKAPVTGDLIRTRDAYVSGADKNPALQVGGLAKFKGGPKENEGATKSPESATAGWAMQPTGPIATTRPMQEFSPSYGGSGEKGTGFENFQRYADANKGAISKWQSEHEKAAKAGQTALGNDISTAESDFTAGLAAPGEPNLNPENPAEAPAVAARAGAQKAYDDAKAAQQAFQQDHQGTLPKDWSQEDRATMGKLARDAEKAAQGLQSTPAHAATDKLAPLRSAIDVEQQHRDTVAALDFYKSQSAQKIQSEAEDVAKRTSELSGAEGMFGAMRERGETVGQATLGASLLGSGDAGRISNEVTAGSKGISSRMEALPGSIEAQRAAELGASDTRAQGYKDALAKLAAPAAGTPGAKTPTVKWDDYMNPLESVLAGIANPRKNLARAGAPSWLGDLIDPAGWLMGTNDERGWEGKIVNTLSDGARHSAAAFRSDEGAVYNTFSDSELLELEKMDEREQRKLIDQRRRDLGMA